MALSANDSSALATRRLHLAYPARVRFARHHDHHILIPPGILLERQVVQVASHAVHQNHPTKLSGDSPAVEDGAAPAADKSRRSLSDLPCHSSFARSVITA